MHLKLWKITVCTVCNKLLYLFVCLFGDQLCTKLDNVQLDCDYHKIRWCAYFPIMTILTVHYYPSHICSSAQLSCMDNILWTSSIFNFQKSPRLIWSMRTSWPWRCLCSSLWTTTLPASMWPSLKGSLWVIRETTVICLESGPLWEMKRWDSLKHQYSRGPNVLQVNLKISSYNMHFNI